MQRSGRLLIIIGLVLGVLAAAAIIATLNTNTNRPAPVVKLVKVVIAQQNVSLGSAVPAGAVTTADWPEEAVRPDTITDTNQVIGQIATVPIVPGQVLVRGMIVDKAAVVAGQKPGSPASYAIPGDRVAVVYPIDPVSGVASALHEGDRIDMLVSFDLIASGAISGTARRQITQIALQDIEIMHIGLWTAPSDANASGAYLTLLVTPQDALVLKFLRETATGVQFALRGAGNHTVVRTQPVIIDYVDQRFNFGGNLIR
jgi:Flp pilus assembly protein CpaB